MTNPFSTTGARQFGAAPLWGASAADALQPPLRLTVMTGALFGAARASVEVEIARSATVGELLRRVMALAQLAPPADPAILEGSLRLLCAGDDLTAHRTRTIGEATDGAVLLHLIAPGGLPSSVFATTSANPARSAAANAAAAAAEQRAAKAAATAPAQAPSAPAAVSASRAGGEAGVLKVRFAAREVRVQYDPAMTASRLKSEIATADGTAVAGGLRLFFSGQELIDALPLHSQRGRLAAGAVITAHMVDPTHTPSKERLAPARSHVAGGDARTMRFVGLRNQGNTCYLNSLVQCLYMTPELRRGLSALRSTPAAAGAVGGALSSLFSSLSSASAAVGTETLTRALTSALVGGCASRQEDVHEFWQVLTDKLETELKSTPQAELLPSLFRGTQRCFVRCSRCGNVTHTDDTFQDPQAVRTEYGSLSASQRSRGVHSTVFVSLVLMRCSEYAARGRPPALRLAYSQHVRCPYLPISPYLPP